MDAELPPSLEWVAFDIRMSYRMMGGTRNSHMLTYQTTRKVKYTQMLHIWRDLTGPGRPEDGFLFLSDEYARAAGLCKMNAGFEMIWCDFTSSSFPLPTRTTPTEPTSSPPLLYLDWDLLRREPFRASRNWGWHASSTLHYGSSGDGPGIGEFRVKPDTCGFMTYYNPVFRSEGIPRRLEEQRVLNLTKEGFWLGPANRLARGTEKCSGADWSVMTHEIVQTYSSPLLKFSKSLAKYRNHTSNNTLFREWMDDVQQQTHMDANGTTWARGSALFNKGVVLGPEETLLKLAVEETMGGICSAVIETKYEVQRWVNGIQELMAWLGWAGEWIGREKKCSWDESCYIPMWPLFHPGDGMFDR
ncbi:hypothetical protein BKA65DRAFT_608278 [Rhexocercosporidium sp. MPI-PUGE-AT-0058]|nr:hypothetical protein BKA65DRAFT_608278 [Rhexocercosporidium sp. MPI-PUGE-AT-0058]